MHRRRAGDGDRSGPGRDHERAPSADQPRLPAARLLGRRGGRRAGDVRPLVRPVRRSSGETIESPGAWLTKVASRICLDLLGSARARRERYVGDWIPEPVPGGPEWIDGRVERPHGRSGRSGHARRVDQHGLPRRPRDDDPRRAGRLHPARRLPLLLRRGGRGRRPYAGAPVVSSPRRPGGTSARGGLRHADRPTHRPRPGVQGGLGRPRTSRPWSACSTPTPRRSPTAAAWSRAVARPDRGQWADGAPLRRPGRHGCPT